MLDKSVENDIALNFGALKKLQTLRGGRNNQAYKIETASGVFFLKVFPVKSKNSQYKLLNEFLFCQEVNSFNDCLTPKPLYVNTECFYAVYSFVEGDVINIATDVYVNQSLFFIMEINKLKGAFNNYASEAVFKLRDFVFILVNRIDRFNFEVDRKGNSDVIDFVNEISIRCNVILKNNPDIDWELNIYDEFLSPSDFGFHNALLVNKKVVFFDFEYAGLDCSWKFLSDFFCQPQVEIDIKYIDKFIPLKSFDFLKTSPDKFIIAFELTSLKWCLILLNEYLKEICYRRVQSKQLECKNVNLLIDRLKKDQFDKSKKYFYGIDRKVAELKRKLL